MSPFKTHQKTVKKGDEKKTEPTVADPSATSLPKNTDKVKGQSAVLIPQKQYGQMNQNQFLSQSDIVLLHRTLF